MRMMRAIFNIVDRTIITAVAAVMITIVTTTFLQVVSRYVFQSPFLWTEELARVCGIWLTYLGAATVYRHGAHIAIDLIVEKFSTKPQFVFRVVAELICGAFASGILAASIVLITRITPRATPALHIPIKFVYAAASAGTGLIVFFTFERLILLFQSPRYGDDVKC